MLSVGDPAPAFALLDDSGQRVDSRSLAGRRYVLYFYPKDDTPGCTKEACSFRDRMPAFEAAGVAVFGVSADDVSAHAKFRSKYQLNFPLLADPEHQLLEAYGVWVEKSMYGKKYLGVQRATFVIGADGRIEKVWEKVKPEGHADEVHAYLSGAADETAESNVAKRPPRERGQTRARSAPAKQASPARPRGGTPTTRRSGKSG